MKPRFLSFLDAGAKPTSLGLAVLGGYWGHLYAQTGNILIPITMHATWNAVATFLQASLVEP